jgi:hypothetical protein
MTERITWVRCLSCDGPAVVGWMGDEPVEFDCPGSCPQLGGQLDRPAVEQAWTGRPPSPTEQEHVLAWSRDLREQSVRLQQEARSACARSIATVRECRAHRRARASAMNV